MQPQIADYQDYIEVQKMIQRDLRGLVATSKEKNQYISQKIADQYAEPGENLPAGYGSFFDAKFDNPLEQIDDLQQEARELNEYCACGGVKLPESNYCQECI